MGWCVCGGGREGWAGNQRADELMAMPTTPPRRRGRRRAPSKREVDSYNRYRRSQPLTLLRISPLGASVIRLDGEKQWAEFWRRRDAF